MITNPNIVPIKEADEVRTQCVLLIIIAVVSFRSVPKILSILQPNQWQPHFTSVINWTLRYGLALLQAAGPMGAPWVAIVDASIDVAVQKVLLVLRVPVAALQMRGSAITLQDAECIGIATAVSWNGESVSSFLKETFDRVGAPVAIIKDGGSDLNKGIRLLNADRQIAGQDTIQAIEDIGHFAANALKAAYATLLVFQNFLTLICKAAAKLRQSELAYLTPPKLRSKGRFQNITKIAKWAARILELLDTPGCVYANSISLKLRTFVPNLAQYRAFIEDFSSTCQLINSFLALMKNKGLNQNTYSQAKAILEQLPEKSTIRERLLGWLERQRKIHTELKLDDMGLLVSSDIIESIFGKFKLLVARNPKAEFNRIVLSLVTLCGKVSPEAISSGLRQIKQSDIEQWAEKNITASQNKLRRAFVDGKLHPNRAPKTGIKLRAESA